MRIEFSPGDVEALIKRYGLPAGATAEQVADRVLMRVTGEDDPIARARANARRRAGTPNRGRPAQPASAEGEQLISDAVAAGKFPEHRADYYRRRYARDPISTADYIGRLAAVPPRQISPELALYEQAQAAAGSTEDWYPPEWLRPSDAVPVAPRMNGHSRRNRITSED